MPAQPRLIGLDWGTSTLRAYLLGDDGTVIARRSQPWGVMSTPGRDFAAALHATVDDWDAEHPGLPAIAAGMIGSTEGWVRAPYCSCPAGLDELAAQLVPIPEQRDGTLHVIPGVEQRGALPNVMRGEETQIAGALARVTGLQSGAVVALPGTHSKWVDVHAEQIVRFETYLTGELYALLAEHSILGRPARAVLNDGAPADRRAADDAFDQAVSLVRDNGARGVAPLLFLTRSLVLSGKLRAEVSLDFLSGLVIADEVRSVLPPAGRRVALIGDPALCARYERALAAFGFSDIALLDDTAAAGLWRIACHAGLVVAAAVCSS